MSSRKTCAAGAIVVPEVVAVGDIAMRHHSIRGIIVGTVLICSKGRIGCSAVAPVGAADAAGIVSVVVVAAVAVCPASASIAAVGGDVTSAAVVPVACDAPSVAAAPVAAPPAASAAPAAPAVLVVLEVSDAAALSIYQHGHVQYLATLELL